MAEFKITIGDLKGGKTYKREVKDDEARVFVGKRIGDKVKGDSFGLGGYELEITGGSDDCGFPMRKDVQGPARKRILIAGGVGIRAKRKGLRLRKTVVGNTVGDHTAQINCKVVKAGKKPIDAPEEEPAAQADAPAEEKPAEAAPEKQE